jgi:NAD(P)H-flavin reductase
MLLAIVLALCLAHSLDGSGNNVDNPQQGAIQSPFMGTFDWNSNITNQAAARRISNELFAKYRTKTNPKGLSMFHIHLGHFLALDLSKIVVNATDAISFETICSGTPICVNESIPFFRARHQISQGHRRVLNFQTSFLDCSHIYGTSIEQNQQLRTMQGGFLRVGEGNLPPIHVSGNATGAGRNRTRFLLGDDRGNETPILQAFYTLFVREHNRKARELFTVNPNRSDEELFQEARKWVIAIWQKMVYDEFLPLLLGEPVPSFVGYNATCDASVTNLFGAAAFRYGHSQVGSSIYRAEADGSEFSGGSLLLRDVYFDISPLQEDGIDPILMGLVYQDGYQVDGSFVNDLREFAVPAPHDLPAINILRGRDLGLLTYNDARRHYSLPPIRSFDAFMDPIARQVLPTLYVSVEDVDVFVGGILESSDHVLGELFHAIIKEQFLRTRNCDRYWYQNPGQFPSDEVVRIQSMTFAKLVELNTGIRHYPPNPLYRKDRHIEIPHLHSHEFIDVASGELRLYATRSARTGTMTFCKRTVGWFAIGFGSLSMLESEIFMVTRTHKKLVVTKMKAHGNVFPHSIGVQEAKEMEIEGFDSCVEWDLPLANITGITKMIYAYSNNVTVSYHGNSRGSLQVMFVEGSATLFPKVTEAVRAYHLISMLITYLLIFPLGIFFAGYSDDMKHWVHYHHVLMTIALFQTLSAAFNMILSLLPSQNPLRLHRVVGFSHMALLVSNYVLGSLLRFWPTIFETKTKRSIHRCLGYMTFSVGLVNCFLGVMETYPSHPFVLYVLIGYVLILCSFFVGAKAYDGTYLQRWSDTKRDESLPTFSWEEYIEHVGKGAKWIVIGDRVYDVRTFLAFHPGGQALLESVIGTDATDQFGVRYQKSNRYNWGHLMVPFRNRVIEIPNVMHRHSRFANFKLQTLLIGYLEEQEVLDRSSVASRVTIEEKYNQAISPVRYTSWELIDRTVVTDSNTKDPTFLFTFAFAEKHHTVECHPGDWISLSLPTHFGLCWITRAFTPIHVRNVGTMEFLIKIVPHSRMGTRLLGLNKGDKVQVQGLIRNISIFRSFHQKHWDDVFLICNGSGLCESLMMIDYLCSKRMFYGTIVLFCHFANEQDIVKKPLQALETCASVKIKVFLCLQVAPPGWKGLCGPITSKTIAIVGKEAHLPYFSPSGTTTRTWFSCSGTPQFCARTKSALADLGIPLDNVCIL